MADCLADLILRQHADRPGGADRPLTLVAGVDTARPGTDRAPTSPARSTATSCPRPWSANWPTASACCPGLDTRTGPAAATSHSPTDIDGDDGLARGARPPADPAPGDPRPRDVRTSGGALGRAAGAPSWRHAEELLAASPQPTPRPGSTGARAARAALDPTAGHPPAARHRRSTERPRIAVTDRLSGTLLALTDSSELRRGRRRRTPGSARPPGTRRPTSRPIPSYRFVRLRDRTLPSSPSCTHAARGAADLDHQVPHPHGPHRARQSRLPVRAPTTGSPTRPRARRLHRDPDGSLVVDPWSPSGHTHHHRRRALAFGDRRRQHPAIPRPARTGRQALLDVFHHDPAADRGHSATWPRPGEPTSVLGHGAHLERPLARAIEQALADQSWAATRDSRVRSGLFSLNTRRPHLSLNTASSSPLVALQHLGAAGGRRPRVPRPRRCAGRACRAAAPARSGR